MGWKLTNKFNNKTRICPRHEARGKRHSATGFEIHRPIVSPSTSSTFLTTSSMLHTSSIFPFRRKRTWMCFLLLGFITSAFNFVPSIVFADSVRTEKQHVKPTVWDPVTSSKNGPSTTPVSLLDELSTPPLTTPSNYRTWKNTNRVKKQKKKDLKSGDDFRVGSNHVTNRVDVDWHNDVIAFEDEDDDEPIDDDDNIFYYYDDGGEDDSYDGKSSMESIHNVDGEDDDIVVLDGDIYPKRIPVEEYNEQIRYHPKIDTSGPPAKSIEKDAGYNEEQTTFRWRWRQRQKQRLRERRRQRQRQEERRKLQQLRHGVPLRPHSFLGTSGRWRENRRIDRPHSYSSDVVYFPPSSPFPNLSSIRQKRKKKQRKPFVSSFAEASPHQPYQLQQEDTPQHSIVNSTKSKSNTSNEDGRRDSTPETELLPQPSALIFEHTSSASPPPIHSRPLIEEHITRPSVPHILFEETESESSSTDATRFNNFFVTTFSSSDDFYGNDIVSGNGDFFSDTSSSDISSGGVSHVIKQPVHLAALSWPQTGNSFRIPKHPPKLRLYTSHLREHPHHGGTVEYHHAPSVKQLIPSVESSGSRRRVDHGRSVDGGGSDLSDNGGNSFFRTMLGVPSYCLAGIEGDLESKCVLTPVCWLNGGVPHPGCNSMLYTCCVDAALSRKDTLTETGRSVDNSILVGNRWRSGKEDKKFSKEPPVKNEPECGITKHRAFSKRIIGGKRAKFAELPWQVHIRISSYQCGGVLLNHWYVATAAHCVHQAKLSKITVHIGEFDTKNTEKVKEPLDSESFQVEKITLHPDFRYMLTQPDRFDIALLRLDRPVAYRDNMIPICLPTKDYPLVKKVGVVAGWGKTDNSFGKTGTNLLNKVHVPIIDNRKCRSWHRDKAIAVQLHKEMFCAGHLRGKMDACLGDSGGPLVINFDGRWTLVGITSAGFGCAVEKQPGIYHRVGKTARWISKMIYQ